MSAVPLIVKSNLETFFIDEIANAKNRLGIKISDLAEFYLVHLLCDFALQANCPKLGEQALALQYQKAVDALPGERLIRLKDLGDESLYIAGFFTEFIEHSLVDVSYYISMGGNAYSSLSDLVSTNKHAAKSAVVYEQLAVNFSSLVDLLNQVADQTRATTNNHELLHLYERWLRTGSTRVQKLLHENGLYVRQGLPSDYEQ
ncbi:MAG: hypothetical protein JW841_17335 [Deltaproteobacteria bacterium]|nr:hypothetical protein [Deltaproteobacteria bacterium]